MGWYSDNFNRADNVDLGANWDSGYTSRDPLQIVSNKVRPSSTARNVESVNALTVLDSQFARIKIVTLTGAGGSVAGVILRAAAPATDTYYRVLAQVNTAGVTSRIEKNVAGVGTDLATENATTWVTGDILMGTVAEKVLQLFRNGALLLTVVDTAIASGRIGLSCAVTGVVGDCEMDDFLGGDLAQQGRQDIDLSF